MLWKIEGTQLAVLGSIHVLDVANPPLSDAAWREFNTATRVVFEHDFAQPPDVSFARLPPGQSLRALIPPLLFEAAQERCREFLLDVDVVTSYQPWFAGLLLGVEMAKHAGLNHNAGVDRRLWEHARQQGKTIEFLEDAAAALRLFSAAPMEEQLTMLRFAAAEPDAGIAFLNRLVGGWKQRRADIIMACVQERLALMPVMFGRVIEGRNRSWLPRLHALAADERAHTLAVVGALHTVGPVGLPALLRAAGCNVIAVDVSGE